MKVEKVPLHPRRPGLNQDHTDDCTSAQQQPSKARRDASIPKHAKKKNSQQNSRDNARDCVQQNNRGIENIRLGKGVEIGR
jgi:hypothetical protein